MSFSLGVTDIVYFSSNLIVCLLSSQLYQTGCEKISLEGEDIFLNYLFDLADKDLKIAMSKADGDISNCIAIKFMKGLLANIVDVYSPPTDSLIGILIDKYSSYDMINRNTPNNHQSSSKRVIGRPDNVALVVREAFFSLIDLPLQAIKIILRNIYSERLDLSQIDNSANFTGGLPKWNPRYLSRFPISERCSNILSLLLQNKR